MCLVVVPLSGLAEDRTITTRSGLIYEKAAISKTEGSKVIIFHAGGLARILVEDLPEDIQQEVGYTPNPEKEAETDRARKQFLASLENPSQAQAAGFAGQSPDQIYEMFGRPMKTKKGGKGEYAYTKLIYEDTKDKETYFFIARSNNAVAAGKFKGLYIVDKDKFPMTADAVDKLLKDQKIGDDDKKKFKKKISDLLKQF